MQRNRFYLLSGDLLAFLAAYVFGCIVFWQIRQPDNLFESFFRWFSVYSVIIPLGIARFYLKGHYTRRWPFWDEISGIFQVLSIVVVIEGALIFLTKSAFSRIWFGSTALALFAFLPALRLLVKEILLRTGKWLLPTVIVGSGENAADVLAALNSERFMGFDVRFFWSLEQSAGNVAGVQVQPIAADIEQVLSTQGIACVFFALDSDDMNGKNALLERLHRYTQDLYIVPAMRGVPLYGMEIHHFFRHEVIMMRVRNNLLRPAIRLYKRCFDIFGAIMLLCLFSPLLILLGLLVCSDGGPIFFAHNRVGAKGKPFRCLKFRSMVTNADEVLKALLENDPLAGQEWQKDFKLKKDPRITWVGAVLRKFSLDELPQLWNVLKGEMSLVGPRPLVEGELSRYGDRVDYYLQVRPGMTGLWQVSGRNDVDYSHRVYLDVWYVKNWSLWYDIVIILKTFKAVLAKQGAY